MNVKTLVVGVSPGKDRYANKAVEQLHAAGHEVVALGVRGGESHGVPILTGTPPLGGIDTVTLYVNPPRQAAMVDYLLSLSPRRVIFNPGTENPEFQGRAGSAGVEAVVGCTLVMLSLHRF